MPVGSEGHPKSDVMCGLSPGRAARSSGHSDLGMAGSLHPPFGRLAPHGEALPVLVGGGKHLSLAAEWLSTWGVGGTEASLPGFKPWLCLSRALTWGTSLPSAAHSLPLSLVG